MATQMDNLTVPKKASDTVQVAAVPINTSFVEAQQAYQELHKCDVRLQAVYDATNRSVKDKLYTVLLQIRNAMYELTQVHPSLAKKED
jgi:hypothetical protein